MYLCPLAVPIGLNLDLKELLRCEVDIVTENGVTGSVDSGPPYVAGPEHKPRESR